MTTKQMMKEAESSKKQNGKEKKYVISITEGSTGSLFYAKSKKLAIQIAKSWFCNLCESDKDNFKSNQYNSVIVDLKTAFDNCENSDICFSVEV